MAQTTEGVWFLALQYSAHEVETLRAQLELYKGLIESVFRLEKAHCLTIDTDERLELFKAYKGHVAKIKVFQDKKKKKRVT